MWDSRCIDSISSFCTPLPPQESSCSHDLALYSLSSSFHFHVNGNPEHFCSLSCVTEDINCEKLTLIPSKYQNMQISKFYCEAFGYLLFVIIFQPLAVNPPSLLHSSMLLPHLNLVCPTILCCARMCLPQFHSDFLVANCPCLSNSFHTTPCSLPAY